MMIAELLHELATKGIGLWPDGEQLRYSAPERALTAEILAQLKAHKSELLAYLQGAEEHPLSYGQRGLWFDYIMTPTTDYHVSTVARIGSVVDVNLLRAALQQLVNRHAALRTTFVETQGEPLQRVQHYQAVSFTQVDAGALDQETLQAQIMAYHELPFDLAQGPLFRVTLFTRHAEDHVLLLTMHHLVIDGASLGIIIRDLRELYRAAQQQTTAALPPAPISYTDYVAWQREMVATDGTTARAFWHEQLAGELPLLDLPTDRPHPPVRTQAGAAQPIELSADLAQQLRLLARREGVTLYTLLLAAYQLFLYRYTGQEDLLVGSVAAGRNRPEFTDIVGYFASPVVMRTPVHGEMSFRALLQDVQQRVLAVLNYQDYPFPLLVEELHPARTLGRLPIFQASFLLQKPTATDGSTGLVTALCLDEMPYTHDWNGLRLSQFVGIQNDAQFDLFLEMVDVPDGLEGAFKYSPDLFDADTVARMAGHWQTLLVGIVANPDASIAQLPLLTAEERHQLLVEWNDTATDCPKDKCIHQLFEEQVERAPDAIAVVFADEQLTYHELNSRANQLAHHLIELSVQANTLVAVAMERSVEMVVSLLAVLKAGGAYIPIDSTYPVERISYMLTNSAAPVLLTQSHLTLSLVGEAVNRAAEQKGMQLAQIDHHSLHVITVDQIEAQLASYSPQNPLRQVATEHLAYVIYTSGSTGQPKGVMIPHDNLFNLVVDNIKRFGLSPDTCVMHAPTFGFDVGVGDLFMTLCSGAKLYLPAPERLIGEFLSEQLRRSQATHISLTPTALSTLSVEPYSHLQHMIVAGEALPDALTQSWLPYTALWNAYGPTENTIYTTAIQCQVGEKVHIGRPIANVTAFILDKTQQLVPIGVAGELYIGGGQLAIGYLNRPDLTTERFIDHPDLGRLYKTGDLCRWLPDGNIAYLGRTDFQVKLRGFRIELGEIENALLAHDHIREAVVLMREDQVEDKRLVAYVVIDGNIDTDVLRQHLKQHLPEYMIPSAFVRLEAMPLSPNGKLDRHALPAPYMSQLISKEASVPPCTTTEKTLAGIWAQVLSMPKLGIHDDFFAIGGHSLLATQIISRINTAYDIQLPFRHLFQQPTIHNLARTIDELITMRKMLMRDIDINAMEEIGEL